MAAPAAPSAERCPWCGRPLRLISVHGQEQCAWCGAPVLPCCEGSPLGPGEACLLPELPVSPQPPPKKREPATAEAAAPNKAVRRSGGRRKRRSAP